MPIIKLDLLIKAPPERVFDLSRSIDLHQLSVSQTNEKAIAGRTEGLIELGERVTWRARHLGVYQKLTVEITAYDFPHSFVDEMVKGAFQSFRHTHTFEAHPNGTLMKDEFDYRSPLGPLGRLADWLFLEAYMRRFLLQRNQFIKKVAESDEWKKILPAEK